MSDLALIEAVKAGEHATAESLIRGGADVNQEDEQGWTPLNFAAGKGDLVLVKLLVENKADIFKAGRDQRRPYKIALAAGRVEVAKYLREKEDSYAGEKPERAEQKYCKAYHLGELRKYEEWREVRKNWRRDRDDAGAEEEMGEEMVVFIHEDYTVTESVYRNENVIFDQVDERWKEYCAEALKFKVPDELDFMVANEASA